MRRKGKAHARRSGPGGRRQHSVPTGRAETRGKRGAWQPAPAQRGRGAQPPATGGSRPVGAYPRIILVAHLFSLAGSNTGPPPIGTMPDPTRLPVLPVFSSSTGGVDSAAAAAAAAAKALQPPGLQPATATSTPALASAGPYNPAAVLPPKVVKKILDLEFVEMAELKADIWVDDTPACDGGQAARRGHGKPPVTDIKLWLECFARMAAILATWFPEKGPELWAYQTTILRAAHNYEGANWVAYDRQYRRDMLARKDLNWSVPNARLYNEAFTGWAKVVPPLPTLPLRGPCGGKLPPQPQSSAGWVAPGPSPGDSCRQSSPAIPLGPGRDRAGQGGVPQFQ